MRLVDEDMKDLYFLLSSSQGIALSKCYSFITSPEPDWQVIARLVAVISSIFPDQAEFQFSDGRHTFLSKPQATEYGSHYFITIFAEGGHLINDNDKCLSRYIGFVVTVLFQQMLSECLAQLEEKAILAIQNSTYVDTIQSDSANGDGSFESTQSSLHYAFPEIMDCLGVFEEHFVRELLMSDEEISYNWFLPVSNYLRDCPLINDGSFFEVNVVYHLSSDDMLIPIMIRDVNGVCQCEQFSEDLRFGLIEYAHAVCSSSLCIDSISRDEGWSCHPSHVINITTNLFTSKDGNHFDPSVSSFFAVSHFKHVGQTLLVACHIPQMSVLKSGIEHVTMPIKTRINHEKCILVKKRTEYIIYSMSSLPADLCDAWRITVGLLHTAFHLAHNDTDNLQVANYYTALNHIIDHCSLEQEEQHLNELKSSGSGKSFNSDEEEYFKLSIDTVEYFPQPPIARADLSTRIVKAPGGQLTVDKTISRPGRTYV